MNVRVRHVLSDGLVVSFLMFFQGTVDLFHMREVYTHLLLPSKTLQISSG